MGYFHKFHTPSLLLLLTMGLGTIASQVSPEIALSALSSRAVGSATEARRGADPVTPSGGAESKTLAQAKPAQGNTLGSLLTLTNAERTKAKLGNLRLNTKLAAAAQRQADDMARSGQFSHTGSDGSQMGDRVKSSGYRFSLAAENIYMQSPSNRAERAIAGWMNSKGHRENLLNGQFTEIGLGYASRGNQHYYVQVFGKPRS